jgi:hypothetical protein
MASKHSPYVTYFILADYGPGIGAVFPETAPATSLRAVVDYLAHYNKIDAVYCADMEAGTWTDATEEVAEAVASQLDNERFDDLCSCKQDLLERFGLVPDDDDVFGSTSRYEQQRREAVMAGHFL